MHYEIIAYSFYPGVASLSCVAWKKNMYVCTHKNQWFVVPFALQSFGFPPSGSYSIRTPPSEHMIVVVSKWKTRTGRQRPAPRPQHYAVLTRGARQHRLPIENCWGSCICAVSTRIISTTSRRKRFKPTSNRIVLNP